MPKRNLFLKNFLKKIFLTLKIVLKTQKSRLLLRRETSGLAIFYSDVLNGNLFLSCFREFDKDFIYCVRVSALLDESIFERNQTLYDLSVLIIIKIYMELIIGLPPLFLLFLSPFKKPLPDKRYIFIFIRGYENMYAAKRFFDFLGEVGFAVS